MQLTSIVLEALEDYMSLPKIGMHHKDVKTRVKRLEKTNNPNKEVLTKSLLGQAEKHEKGAGSDIANGLNRDARGGCNTNLINNSSASFKGLSAEAWERIFGGK